MTLLMILLACTPETTIKRAYPEMAVLPNPLDFGEVELPQTGTVQLQITNSGLGPLQISDITVTSDEGDVFAVTPAWPESIKRDEVANIPVTFTPETFITYTGELVITYNGEDSDTFSIPVSGTGVNVPLPDIDVSPRSIDFGTVTAGTASTQYFTINNRGNGDLEVTVEQTGSGAFGLVGATTFTVPAEQSLPVIVTYSPTSSAGDAGGVTLHTNDPDSSDVEVVMIGNGGGDFEYPVAQIVVDSPVRPRTLLFMDGRTSYDPNGLELTTYNWTLTHVDSGREIDLINGSSSTPQAQVDIAGDYDVTLQVCNEVDVCSAPAHQRVEVIPDEDIHVELLWDGPSADFDLHVVQDGGDFFQEPYDACFCNPEPDWGDSGASNDPSLDIDDRSGYGPENINVAEPADGDYTIYVHYFADNADDDVVATLRVFTYGELVSETSRVMSYNNVWQAGRVRWPAGAYLEDDILLDDAPHRACYE